MDPLDSGDLDHCPRCGGRFHCGAADAGPCDCTGLSLSPALQASLRTQYEGCLCLACLRGLAAQEQAGFSAAPAAGGG